MPPAYKLYAPVPNKQKPDNHRILPWMLDLNGGLSMEPRHPSPYQVTVENLAGKSLPRHLGPALFRNLELELSKQWDKLSLESQAVSASEALSGRCLALGLGTGGGGGIGCYSKTLQIHNNHNKSSPPRHSLFQDPEIVEK